MQTIANLTKQNFIEIQPLTTTHHSDSQSVSITQICLHLTENFKFQITDSTDDQEITNRLTECITHLLKRNEKLFIRIVENEPGVADNSPDNYRYKLNAVYIHKKLIDQKKTDLKNDSHLVKNENEEKRNLNDNEPETKVENGIKQANNLIPKTEQSTNDSSPKKKIKSSDSNDVNKEQNENNTVPCSTS